MKVSVYSRERMEGRLAEGTLEGTAVVSFYDPPAQWRTWEEPVD